MGRHSLYRRHLRIVPGIQGRIVLSTEQVIVIGQITVTGTYGKVYRNAVVIVVFVMRAFYFPHLAGYHSVQSPHGQIKVPKNSRVKREKPRLESSSTKEDIRCVTSPRAMPLGGCHQVIDGGRLHFCGYFPHQTTSKGVWSRFPKGKSVAACCIEIKISVIGVGEQLVENWSLSIQNHA